jgi:hypothetical protein
VINFPLGLRGSKMKTGFVVVSTLAAMLLSGCAIQRAQVAKDAQTQLIGMSKESILACMGVPNNRTSEGATEVWLYQSGNGETEGSAFATGGRGYAGVFGASEQRFCTINVVMTNGAVNHVNYSGPTGGLLTACEQCAFAVQNCVHK